MSEVEVFIIPGLRIVRVFLMMLGLVSLLMIMRGSFDYMTFAVRDDVRSGAIKNIAGGVTGMVILGFLFAISSVALQNLS